MNIPTWYTEIYKIGREKHYLKVLSGLNLEM